MPTTEEFITRREHDEFAKRIEENDKRQNKRLEVLEESIKEINRLATSIEKIATNQEFMIKEQTRQCEMLERTQDKIDAIEREPIEIVKSSKKKIIETIITVVVTALVVGAIMVISQNI